MPICKGYQRRHPMAVPSLWGKWRDREGRKLDDNIVKFKPPVEKIEDAAVTYLKTAWIVRRGDRVWQGVIREQVVAESR
jgi:hypothetical protein